MRSSIGECPASSSIGSTPRTSSAQVPLPLGPDRRRRACRRRRRRRPGARDAVGVDRRLTAQLRRERCEVGRVLELAGGVGRVGVVRAAELVAAARVAEALDEDALPARVGDEGARGRRGAAPGRSGIVSPPSECPTTIASSTPPSAARTTAAYSVDSRRRSRRTADRARRPRWPRASSSARSGSQAHPPCQAPCTRQNVATR